MIIYKWTHKINGKVYIGQSTKTLDKRIQGHINTAAAGSEQPIHYAIRKYGVPAFIVEVIATAVSISELNSLEIQYIKQYDSRVPKGYNLKGGGDNHSWHPESKVKASKAAKKRMIADKGAQFKAMQIKGQQAVKGTEPWNKGKKATAKAIENQSKAHLGQIAWNKAAVICNETQEVFNSIKEAALKLNLQSSKICNVLKGKRKHTRGLTFSYLKEIKNG